MMMKEFREHLQIFPDDWTAIFAVDGIPLHFFRAKKLGDKLVQLEFNECPEPEHRLVSSQTGST